MCLYFKNFFVVCALIDSVVVEVSWTMPFLWSCA